MGSPSQIFDIERQGVVTVDSVTHSTQPDQVIESLGLGLGCHLVRVPQAMDLVEESPARACDRSGTKKTGSPDTPYLDTMCHFTDPRELPGAITHTPVVHAIGHVESALKHLIDCPRQPDENGPPATIVIAPALTVALDGIEPGDRVLILTWLHAADRTTLVTQPRDDPQRMPRGVFATRSADRPNPIGVHETVVTSVEDNRLGVMQFEALDATPVLDIKPVLEVPGRR